MASDGQGFYNTPLSVTRMKFRVGTDKHQTYWEWLGSVYEINEHGWLPIKKFSNCNSYTVTLESQSSNSLRTECLGLIAKTDEPKHGFSSLYGCEPNNFTWFATYAALAGAR